MTAADVIAHLEAEGYDLHPWQESLLAKAFGPEADGLAAVYLLTRDLRFVDIAVANRVHTQLEEAAKHDDRIAREADRWQRKYTQAVAWLGLTTVGMLAAIVWAVFHG